MEQKQNLETEYKKDRQARDWVFVVNNPKLTEEEMSSYLQTIVNVRYFIFAREKGDGSAAKDGTEHHQGYIEFTMPKRFSTMKKIFSEELIGVNGHLQERKTKRINCVNYVKKIGKHKEKEHTRISELFEFGEFVGDGERTDIADMVQMKRDGASDIEIFESFENSFARYGKFIKDMGLEYKTEKFKYTYRNIEVYYLFGATRTGKSRYSTDMYGFQNVYENEGYEHGKWFDGYEGQDVLLLDEYRDSFDFSLLLKYLDGRPCRIQCRRQNKQACYTKVFITSNIPLEQQHKYIQTHEPESWKALLARITGIKYFNGKKIIDIEVPKINPATGTTELSKADQEELDLIFGS